MLPVAPNVPVPNAGVAAAVPNKFVDCVVAVAPNKPYTVPYMVDTLCKLTYKNTIVSIICNFTRTANFLWKYIYKFG